MKHTTLDELQRVASVQAEGPRAPILSRTERLVRWAELLEQDPERYLNALPGTEYQTADRRGAMRTEDSPISVAYRDPILRMDGLPGDSYGDAKGFFDLTDWQLHDIVCHCHYGSRLTAAAAAQRVRSAIEGGQPGFLTRVRQVIAG